MRSKRFLSHLILTLTDAENTKPDHDEKSLHHHTIPSFASTKSPFELQLGSRETPHASHPETEEKRCLRSNQRRAAQAVWVGCEPPHPNVIPERANSLAVVEGVLSRFFQTTAAASAIRHVFKARSEVPRKSPGKRKLGVV